MIYSAQFEALPQLAKDAIYRRMWQILSGRTRARPTPTWPPQTVRRSWTFFATQARFAGLLPVTVYPMKLRAPRR